MTEKDLFNFGDRVIDKQGNVVYFTNALVSMLYNGIYPTKPLLVPEDDIDIKSFNKLSYENFDDIYYKSPTSIQPLEERVNEWFYPEEYENINLDEYFDNLCQTNKEKDRVKLELSLYREKGFEKFLRFCIYLSDKIKENDWVIGVGRGSSCSSYLLYLLKIHLVNSLEYDLNIKEFLK